MSDVAVPETEADAEAASEERHRLTVLQGLSALSLDALSSVAYGPEAIVLVLAAAGTGALTKALPVTIVIAALLAVLVFAYRQVIAAHPEGGGAYAVSAQQLGQRWSWLAASSLIVDYVLNVGVSVAAGIAALTSTFPVLHSKTLLLCLVVVAGLTAVNLRGVAESARLLIVPTLIFIAAVSVMIVCDIIRSHPKAVTGGTPVVHLTDTVGIWLLLRAFSAGCSALTGVEAIANAVPQFRKPRVRRAQHTEALLGLLLGLMLLGIAHAIGRFHLEPRHGVTILDQLSAGAYGRGIVYYAFGIVTTLVLTLAANTSFGGLPVLLSLLARDNLLPHAFGLRGERPVFRYGVSLLGLAGAALLIAVNGDTQRLVPLFAIGVFIGFTLSQVGLAKRAIKLRTPHWQAVAVADLAGAALTAAAAVVFLATKFLAGAWVVVIAVPALMTLFAGVHRYYVRVGAALGLGEQPPWPKSDPGIVIVPVGGVNLLTQQALSAGLAMGHSVIAVSVQHDKARADQLRRDWEVWGCGVELVVLDSPDHALVDPIVEFVQKEATDPRLRVTVLVPQVEPRRRRYQVLQNQRGRLLAVALRRRTDVVVATLPFRVQR
jgi:amino acid transporter